MTTRLVAQWTGALAGRLERPVVDNTGLTGKYDVKLEWTADLAPEEPGVSLFSVLEERLGLRLQSQKMAVEVVIVDPVERTPTEN